MQPVFTVEVIVKGGHPTSKLLSHLTPPIKPSGAVVNGC